MIYDDDRDNPLTERVRARGPRWPRTEDIPTEDLTELELGDKVTFAEEKRPYTVRAVVPGGRFYILTKPFNAKRTVLYSIIDREGQMRGVMDGAADAVWGVRGPDDRVFSRGYETQEDIDQNAADLATGDIEVSMRHRAPTNITRVQRPVAIGLRAEAAS
jgi:hypothetical protein